MKDVHDLIYALLEKVPAFTEFLTVDELNESSKNLVRKHGDVAELVEVGTSRTGEPMYSLIIRGGEERIVLAFGFPHPNEPVGSLALDFLSWYLAKDKDLLKYLKATWIIIKVADAYGARLNEGWFKGEFSLKKYVLNYYRPPGYKQVEWTFPIEYKTLKWNEPIPETRALMKLIDEWKPTHIYSLHNAGFTGTYYYVTKELPPRVKELMREVPRELQVPLHRGEPEMPYMKKLDEAIFRMPGTEESYDWLERHIDTDPAHVLKHGGSSYDYAKRVNPNVFELVCEVPYLYDDRLDMDIEIGIPRRDVLRLVHEKMKQLLMDMRELNEKMSKFMNYENPFYESFSEFLKFSESYLKAEEKWIETDPQLDESATVAQAFDAYKDIYFSGLLRYGLAHRALSLEVKKHRNKKLEELDKQVLGNIERLLTKAGKLMKYRVVPVKNLVSIQLAAMISTVAFA